MLSIALVCAVGVIQAVHTHPEDSTASHHSCSICSTAHAGLSTEVVAAAPILIAAALPTPVRELAKIFRAQAVHFIRPPPAGLIQLPS
jgi:Fe-S-cluster-containing hydrogenase component 2